MCLENEGMLLDKHYYNIDVIQYPLEPCELFDELSLLLFVYIG